MGGIDSLYEFKTLYVAPIFDSIRQLHLGPSVIFNDHGNITESDRKPIGILRVRGDFFGLTPFFT